MNRRRRADQRVILGTIVRKYREDRGLSQAELANLIGSIQAYISRLERGLENPGLRTMELLAEALGRKFDIAKAWN